MGKKYMKLVILVIVAGWCSIPAVAEAQPSGSASGERTEVALWPGEPPFAGEDTTAERVLPSRGDDVIRVTNVSQPTLTVFPAERSGPAPAVVVCPGGGYRILAMNLEGTEIAEWLNSLGVTALLLKYRVPENRDGAFADAQRAMGIARARAEEWNINPRKIGIMGFSAGGHLSARTSTHFHSRSYQPVDDADSTSVRPDFALLIYPAYLVDENNKIRQDVLVDNHSPPTILVQAQDDGVGVENSVYFYAALTRRGIPAELHVFAHGGHGYGLRVSEGQPLSAWPALCENWLRSLGVIE
ncbi:MAG TPA: alpha/beta hydrolase [bacterium]|nr:alpha/beta hydrolase [bacterium]